MAAPEVYGGVGELQDLFRKAQGARSRFIPDWFLNVAYFAGEQWCNWSGGTLSRPYIDPRRSLVTDNRIMPVISHRVSRKVKNRPTFVCTPYNSDDGAVDAARIGDRVLEADWVGLDLQEKLYAATLWSDVACDGFWKIYWDNTIGEKQAFLFVDGKPLYNPADGSPLRADEMDQIDPQMLAADPTLFDRIQAREIAAGDVCVDVISPFELFPDPLATSMDDCEWMIEEKVRSVDYIKQRYPTTAKGNPFIPTPDADASNGIAEGQFMVPGLRMQGDTSEYKGVKLYEYWSRPKPDYPNGKRCVWANDTLLVEEEPFDPMPYVRFSSIEVPGRFWSNAITTYLRGPQEDLNKIRTQILENAKRLGNPALMKSRHANVEYHGAPGEVIEYDSTVPDPQPSYLVPPPIPAFVENEVGRLEKSLEEISGIHEVSKAEVPAGVTAASAINLLQEQDDTRLGPEIQAQERALQTAGTKILRLRAQFNTDERTIRLAGEDGNWDIFKWKGAALGTEPTVEVQAGSAMPRSKAAKQAAMTELLALAFQYQIPINHRNLRKFFKDYEVGGLDRLFENISNDEQQVTREHRMLYNGEAFDINSYDDDDFHIEAHSDEQKSSRYASADPAVKQLFDAHIALHRQRKVQMVDAQLAAQSHDQQAAAQQEHAMQLQTEQVKQASKNGQAQQ